MPVVRCRQHPAAKAGWTCQNCGSALCPRCAHRRKAGQGWLIICGQCNGFALPIMVRPTDERFGRLLASAFAYPFSATGLVTMAVWGVIVALVVAGAKLYLIQGIGAALLAVLAAAYTFLVIHTTAVGKQDVPDSDDLMDMPDRFAALLRAAVGLVALGVLFLAYVGIFKWNVEPARLLSDPVAFVTLIPVALGAPMVFLLAVAKSSPATMLNPFAPFIYIGRLGGDYLAVALLFWALFATGAAVAAADFAFAMTARSPGLATLCAGAVSMYFPIVIGRVLGVLVYTRGADIDYDTATELLLPALGNLMPPVELASKAEIDAQLVAPADPPSAPELYRDELTLPPVGEEATPPPLTPPPPSLPPRSLDRMILPPTDDELRMLASSGEFERVADGYRARLGKVDFLSAEELKATADAALGKSDFQTASHALKRLARDHADSPLAPDALLRAGLILTESLGRRPEGRELLDELVHAHPDSPAAQQARQTLNGAA